MTPHSPTTVSSPSDPVVLTGGSAHQRAWWKEASVYQIYPASFKDSTGTGVGDLKGITEKIPYIKALGVDVVWLCPIFESPQIDMGYDCSNYQKIDPPYGTIDDVDELMHGLHKEGMKLILDLVVNHTSDQHEWFKKSKSSKENSEYRDWYIWRKPKYDTQGNRMPPNNWQSHFQGSAWTYDEASDEYYLHLFCPEQPDLNWENPAVRAAVHSIMHFWLSRGIDGFRLDVINYISKPQDFPDGDTSIQGWLGSDLYSAGPRLHEYLREIGEILHKYNAFSVGEMPSVMDPKQVIKSVGWDSRELNMIFHFELVSIDHGPQGKFSPRDWKLQELKTITTKWQQFMYANGGWNAMYLENHDQPRSINRFACSCDKHREMSSKMLAIYLACQAGTIFIYEGQELGMTNVPKEWGMEEYKDVDCLNHWNLHKTTSSPDTLSLYRREYQKKSRDNARTLMQWDNSPHAGFTLPTVTPWMSANPNYVNLNAASQIHDPSSPFTFWSSVLQARKKFKDVLVYGDFNMVDEDDGRVVAYVRATTNESSGEKMLVVCNFSAEEVEWKIVDGIIGDEGVKEVVLSNEGKKVDDFSGGSGTVHLEPFGAFVVRL
ncbi:hypothetical protein B7463_g11941, partial [Scytalidium lignicola]